MPPAYDSLSRARLYGVTRQCIWTRSVPQSIWGTVIVKHVKRTVLCMDLTQLRLGEGLPEGGANGSTEEYVQQLFAPAGHLAQLRMLYVKRPPMASEGSQQLLALTRPHPADAHSRRPDRRNARSASRRLLPFFGLEEE
eukprot:scaffold188756_cov37-Tisochrysis_lutea.AAC.2